jgi:hypothetical protein
LIVEDAVIPTQAGIQLENNYCKADHKKMLSLRGILVLLDSRLRGNDGL